MRITGIAIIYLLFTLHGNAVASDEIRCGDLPFYPGVKNFKIRISDGSEKQKYFQCTLSFDAKVRYPAQNIIHHYKFEMNKMGFVEHSESGWVPFDLEETKRRYVVQWTDDNRKFFITLVILYEKDGDFNNPHVMLQISPFIDLDKFNAFFKKLYKNGRSQAFNDLMEKYTDKDRYFDLEKAMRENPDNNDLLEYYNLEKENEAAMK